MRSHQIVARLLVLLYNDFRIDNRTISKKKIIVLLMSFFSFQQQLKYAEFNRINNKIDSG